MARTGLYIVIGLLCLAMAGGVFLGPGPQKPEARGRGGEQPPIEELSRQDIGRLDKRREVANGLIRAAGGDPKTFTTGGAIVTGLQAVFDKAGDSPITTYQRQCLGVIFGDALVLDVKLKWVRVTEGGREDIALLIPGSGSILLPMKVFAVGPGETGPTDVAESFTQVKNHVDEAKSKR
jgi:hypothetical protein